MVEADIEILEFAISREVDAYHFFMVLADRAANESLRKVFQELAKEELEHKSTLELEMMKLGHTVATERELPGPDVIYVVPDAGPTVDMDYRELLLLGIQKEEASFRTYVDLVGRVSDHVSRDMLLSLAEQEVKHKLRFEMELKALQKQDQD